MLKSPHIIWVRPNSDIVYRSKGEVKCQPSSVAPKLSEKGLRINILVPYNSALLPKTKLTPSRITRHAIRLSQDYPVEIIKLSKGSVSPGIFMVKMPDLEPAMVGALFSKSALALAQQLKRPVDVFHMFEWGASLVPLWLEMGANGSTVTKEARTFLSIRSLADQGNFAPAIMAYIGIPETLFHPDGIEYYGKVSFLKTGLLMSDGISLIDTGRSSVSLPMNSINGMQGVLDAHVHKLRRWVSDRSVRNYLDVYQELLTQPKGGPVLPKLVKKLHQTKREVKSYVDIWGPEPPDRYHRSYIAFLIQAPKKAFAFWEQIYSPHKEYGLVLEDVKSGHRHLLSRGLPPVADYWIDVQPDREYAVELVGFDEGGLMHILMRSKIVRTPRDWMSGNTNAIFIDVRERRRIKMKWPKWQWRTYRPGASEQLVELTTEMVTQFPNLPSSWGKVPSSWTQVPGSFSHVPSSYSSLTLAGSSYTFAASSFSNIPSSWSHIPSSWGKVPSSWGVASNPGAALVGVGTVYSGKTLRSGQRKLGCSGRVPPSLWRALGFRMSNPGANMPRALKNIPDFWGKPNNSTTKLKKKKK
ncbi:MAG: glycogen/starch synthase [Elusimicrobia bacterium]|nr:glycogen/starch synthase [Candidatus Obscuribacterium magneticum]